MRAILGAGAIGLVLLWAGPVAGDAHRSGSGGSGSGGSGSGGSGSGGEESARSAGSAEPGTDAGARPEPEVDDDAVIAAKVHQRLRRDAFTEHYDLRAEVDDGVVTLLGAVQADHEKERAAELARTVDGVEAIENDVVVGKTLGTPDDLPPLTEPGAGGPVPGAGGPN